MDSMQQIEMIDIFWFSDTNNSASRLQSCELAQLDSALYDWIAAGVLMMDQRQTVFTQSNIV